jgi:hypothetical protein
MDCSKVQVYSNPDFSYNSLAEPVVLFPMSIRMCLMVLKKSTNIQMEKSAKCEQYTWL